MNVCIWIIFLVFGLLRCKVTSAYAYLFASESYCNVHLVKESTIMGSTVLSDNSRSIVVMRGSTVLQSGDVFVLGETLSVSLSSSDTQFAYEVTSGGATFVNGPCEGNRFANGQGTLLLPSSATGGSVIISAGSASQFGGLSLTSSFTLSAPSEGVVVTILTPSTPHSSLYHANQAELIAVGVVVGVLGVTVTVVLFYLCARHYDSIAAHSDWLIKTPAVCAVILAIVSLGLVSAWATNSNTSTDTNYLGVPSWTHNTFAWHPVLMVGGFFLAQVLAINQWMLTTSHTTGKLFHVFYQTAALATMIAALCAIVKVSLSNKTPALSSMHSWYGVSAVALFCFNYTLGLLMGILTACWPHAALTSVFDVVNTHRVFGIASICFTALAVGTGIMNQLPLGSCYYVLSEGQQYRADTNPAANFEDHYKSSCKIGNGLGVSVALATAATVLSVVLRSSWRRKLEVTDREHQSAVEEIELRTRQGELHA